VTRRAELDQPPSSRSVKKSVIDTDSLWVTRNPYCAPSDGHHVRTRVLAPGCSRKITGTPGSSNALALAGIQRSCVPQPSSAGWRPSLMKPSTDHVFQKTPTGLGCTARCVSRSAMWIPFTPRSRMNVAHARRSPVAGGDASCPMSRARRTSASFTNQDTIPGLAPQHETAVVPPDDRRRSSITVSRSA
jgi:hypothetical protein